MLKAAAALDDPFSLEQLTVACWQRDNAAFGLASFAELYPDNNKVVYLVSGRKGLVARGWFVWRGPKLYSVAPAGRAEADVDAMKLPERKLSREADAAILAMLNSSAYRRYCEGMRSVINSHDAYAFWSGSPRRAAYHLANAEKLGETTLSDGRFLSVTTIAQLREMHAWLVEKFKKYLA